MRGILLFLLIFLPACSIEIPIDAEQVCKLSKNCTPEPGGADGEPKPIPDSDIAQGYSLSTANIAKLEYNRDSHSLVAKLQYGGCGPTKHSLTDMICFASYPAQCKAKLIRPTPDEITCDAIVFEEMVYPLPADFTIGSVAISSKNNTQTVFVDKIGKEAPPLPLVPSDATLKKLSYERASHSLSVTVSYGGCSERKHSLQISETCDASLPIQCTAILVRPDAPEDSCKKLIEETFNYPLDASFDLANLTVINSKKESLAVLIDKNGGTPPPAGDLVGSAATIKALTYNRQSHALDLTLTYSGCDVAKHTVVIGDVCAESSPLQCGAKLLHAKDFNGSCKKLIEEKISVALDANFDNAVVKVLNVDGKGLSVLVEKRGIVP